MTQRFWKQKALAERRGNTILQMILILMFGLVLLAMTIPLMQNGVKETNQTTTTGVVDVLAPDEDAPLIQYRNTN